MHYVSNTLAIVGTSILACIDEANYSDSSSVKLILSSLYSSYHIKLLSPMKLKTLFHIFMGLWNRFLPIWKLWPIVHALNKLSAEHIFAGFVLSHTVVRDKILDLYRPLETIVNIMLSYVANLQRTAVIFTSIDTLIMSIYGP